MKSQNRFWDEVTNVMKSAKADDVENCVFGWIKSANRRSDIILAEQGLHLRSRFIPP